jgi:hypothetical protein
MGTTTPTVRTTPTTVQEFPWEMRYLTCVRLSLYGDAFILSIHKYVSDSPSVLD